MQFRRTSQRLIPHKITKNTMPHACAIPGPKVRMGKVGHIGSALTARLALGSGDIGENY
jgi:hypothetical protein